MIQVQIYCVSTGATYPGSPELFATFMCLQLPATVPNFRALDWTQQLPFGKVIRQWEHLIFSWSIISICNIYICIYIYIYIIYIMCNCDHHVMDNHGKSQFVIMCNKQWQIEFVMISKNFTVDDAKLRGMKPPGNWPYKLQSGGWDYHR